MSNQENKLEWERFIKLGDMMGDGLHHEPDGKWITREYNKLAKLLIPEIRESQKEKRKLKAERVNENMKRLLAEKKCKCGGSLKQGRSGSKVCYCTVCNSRYVATRKKN